MKKNLALKTKVTALVLLLVILAVILIVKMKDEHTADTYSNDFVSVEEVKQELAFSVYTPEEWDTYFSVYHKDYLTKEMLDQLMEKMGVKEQIKIPGITGQHAVSRKEWADVYEQMLDYLDMTDTVATKTILLLDTMEAADGIILITNEGDFSTKLPPAYFEKWNAYDVYVMKDHCIGIRKVSSENTVIENAYLKNREDESIEFLYAGGDYRKEIGEQNSDLAKGVCDLVFKNGNITKIRMKQDMIEGELLSYDDKTIEIKDYGKIKHGGKIPVYQTYGEVTEKSISDVVLGNMKVAYVNAGEEVCAILILEPAQITDIRVLLLADDGSKFRKEAYLKCSGDAIVACGDTQENISAGSVVSAVDYISKQPDKTFVMKPGTEDAQIFLCDAGGTARSNGYYGSVEVRANQEGYTVVNQLPFETYLYGVVPSEMPSSFQPEALKAQAVCARSYAYMQLLRADLAQYGAHIDDSTFYQVYNKTAQTNESVSAVEATRGKVLAYQGNIIEAYYFSTSMGYTDTAKVWNVEKPEDYGYLKKACLNIDHADKNLSDEQTFLSYIKAPGEGYDSSAKYYRWFATASYQEKTEQINQILESRRSISDKNVLYYESDGKTQTDSLDKMGTMQKLSVEERSSSGAILTLRLDYERGIVKVKTEYNIRKILGCGIQKIVYADASEGESSMLPSAFCALEEQNDGSLMIYGGGYGHGLGMSQNGANGMAKAGMGWEDILHYFYQDVTIEDMK